MKKSRIFLFLTLALLLALVIVTAALAQGNESNFTASLKGRNERPNPVDTNAQGEVIVHISEDESSLSYKLIVANIDEAFAAHIHCGGPDVAGPVGVTLYGGPTVTLNGILAQATVTEPNAGNACGWVTLADVIAAIRSGDAYVNVHTTANPGGEIRGQL